VEKLTPFTKHERRYIENFSIDYGVNTYHVSIPGFAQGGME